MKTVKMDSNLFDLLYYEVWMYLFSVIVFIEPS